MKLQKLFFLKIFSCLVRYIAGLLKLAAFYDVPLITGMCEQRLIRVRNYPIIGFLLLIFKFLSISFIDFLKLKNYGDDLTEMSLKKRMKLADKRGLLQLKVF